jgi:hypothetical protein
MKTKKAKDTTAVTVALIAASATLITAIIGLAKPFVERMANESTATPSVEFSPIPLATSSPAPSPVYPIILKDDFSTNLGLDVWEGEKSFGGVLEGVFRIGVTKPGATTWRTYDGFEISDFHMTVNVNMPLSPKEYACGIVFRQDGKGVYFFGINNNRQYEFTNLRISNGRNTYISLADRLTNISIEKHGINTLEIVAKHDVFELYVNGMKLNSITDATHAKGDFGFYLSAYGGGQETIVEFDNLAIEER